MPGRRALIILLGAALSSAAVVAGLRVAGTCDAADWTQAAMLTVLPLVAVVGAAVAAHAWSRRRLIAILLGLGAGAGSWIASLLYWVASCSA